MSETREIGLALLGLGNVGAGVIKLLEDNAAAIEARLGARIAVRAIAVRAIDKKARGRRRPESLLTTDVAAVISRPDVDIVCELIGGTEEAGVAVLAAIRAGKHVVTANKALLAEHGREVFSAAEEHGVDVYYEAAVCGGVPVIRACARAWRRTASSTCTASSTARRTTSCRRWRRPGAGSPTSCARPRTSATPRPIRRSTSAAATRRTSSRSCACCASARCPTSPRSRATASITSRRSTSSRRPSSAT